jgi:hypothetical protein
MYVYIYHITTNNIYVKCIYIFDIWSLPYIGHKNQLNIKAETVKVTYDKQKKEWFLTLVLAVISWTWYKRFSEQKHK